ncbi:hypothetical protein [Spirosoma oryzae]|nr:hypothetical protein [Spirosoma oryzae]
MRQLSVTCRGGVCEDTDTDVANKNTGTTSTHWCRFISKKPRL